MKGVRFYLEYENKTEKNKGTRKKLGRHTGNVLAVFFESSWIRHGELIFEAIGAVYFHLNSGVCCSATSASYLKENCKRISELQARGIHENLFVYLDD